MSLAAAIYQARMQREMVDFDVYRTAADRALSGEPLYRPADGHYQFKYLPAFALAMAPFALVDREAAKVIWFALSAGLLTAFVRWSVRALPERRRSERVLLWLTVLFMAKFYAHELMLGQTNILLGALLVGALLAVQVDQPYIAGVLIGARGIRQAVRAAAAAVARVHVRLRPGRCRRSASVGCRPGPAGCRLRLDGQRRAARWRWYRTVTRHDRGQPARRRQRLARGDVGQVDWRRLAGDRAGDCHDRRRARSGRHRLGATAPDREARTISSSRC